MNAHFKINVGQELEIEALIEKLISFNYVKTDAVMQQGEFSERGNIVDVYPFNFRLPVRITFGLEKVEAIKGFTLEGEGSSIFENITIVPVHEFFERKQLTVPEGMSDDDLMKPFLKIKRGDCVVHLNYGIGIYLGTKTLKVKGVAKKFLAIEYAEGEILYVEAEGPRVIERYIGMEGRKPKLNKLRTKEWERIKARTRLAVKNVAKELLMLQAKRNTYEGFAFSPDTEWQKQFESEFPYTETPDQIRATEEVKEDMQKSRPMDRLLCGDVGYGKTEVAMRAAFKAIMDNKQVAMLVPTTVLAEQHYVNFKKRVTSFPISVEVLSRFRTRKEQKEIVQKLKNGSCDIVIGTHRLLSQDIRFKNLGLVIIDEEQRFGVHHKEKFKQYRAMVDVLTLTATPIPRTLYMSLMGVRNISMIMTPPRARLPIETHVCDYNDTIIVNAIGNECKRKGQIYFVHNRVQSIDKMHKRLVELLPDVRFAVAHGQMPPSELEKVMLSFFSGKIDCLVCTNIIESGLDVPNANTIIVNRSDLFGLSDLYQLRGRVGRYKSKRKAYAYFLRPKRHIMTSDAEKRLEAIKQYTELGSGFKIAMEDLEMRGAGNLLGHEQSGFIAQVGFDLYTRLLQKAIKEET